MSLPSTSEGYALGPGEGETLWFNRGLITFKATNELTDGRFAALELLAPKGFASPLHLHHDEDEIFLVLDGEVRLRHGETIIEATAGSLVYGPRNVPHAFHVDSDTARMMLLFSPGGVERFFRDAGKPARTMTLPPDDEVFPPREELIAAGAKYNQEFVGPPLPPKD